MRRWQFYKIDFNAGYSCDLNYIYARKKFNLIFIRVRYVNDAIITIKTKP